MVNISKNDDSAIKFTFTNNDRYLYNGEIIVPLNSLILEFDASDLVVFKKIDGDVFVTFLLENSNFATKSELETWFKENAVGGTGGGGGDITSGEVQTMIDESISGKVDASSIVSAITSASTDSEIPSAKLVYDIIAEDEEVTARAIAELNEKKLDASAYTPTDLSEYWTSAQTESAIEASVSGKVATSDFEAYSGTVANEYVSKAENTVSATTIFVNYQDSYSNQNSSENIVRSVIFDYRGDKTSATSQQVYSSIVDLDTWSWYYVYVYFDYTNGTYTKDDSLNIFDVTYDSSIEDFRINISDNYPNYNISNVQFNGGYIRVPFSTITSGQSANVIQTSIANIFGDVYSKNLDALTTCNFSIGNNNNKKIILSYSNGRSSGIDGSFLLLEDLKSENRSGFNYLSSDINISLGTSGWTEVTNLSQDSCNTDYLGDIKPFTVFRISGDASNLSLWGLRIAVGNSWSYYWDNILWDENENTFIREAGWSPDVFSAATVNWDSNTNYLTISYPDTFILDGEERQTEFYYINSQQCQYGNAITKFEYYVEHTQPIKPYVQQLRTDVNTISGQVSSKISTSAVTTAVTSGSTDSEIPSAKAVYDAIGSGGGSITIDPSLDSGSTNAVANSAITTAIDAATATTNALNNVVTAHTANTDIHVTTAQTAAWDAKSNFSGSYNDLTDKPTIPTVPTSNTAFTNDAGYITSDALSGYAESSAVTEEISESISGKADTSAVTESIDAATSGKADTSAVTQEISAAVSGKQDTLVSGTNIKTINNESILGSGNIDIQGGGGKTYSAGTNIEITSADTINCTLPISAFSLNTVVVVGKNNTAETQSYDDYIIGNNSKIDGKSVLSSSYGNNKIFGSFNKIHKGNNNLCVGDSNSIGINGYEASQNNCVVGNNNTISPFIGNTTSTNGNYVYGYNNKIDKKSYNYVVGSSNTVSGGNSCNILGSDNIPMNDNEVILGRYNNSVSDGTTSGNTLLSVGNGTADNARHNAFEIRQNGDIYITSGETDIKLQDNLGGGSVSSAVTSGDTNAVSSDAVYTAMGGLKLQQISQADYDALVSGGTVDSSTLYIITNVVN